MTMIAYRDGVMATDRATWSGGNIMVGQRDKIIRLHNGGMFAAAGSTGVINLFRRYLNDNLWDDVIDRRAPFDCKECGGMVVTPDGTVWHFDDTGVVFQAGTAPYYAEGSASAFMLGALAQGATAAQAVGLAIKYTDYGGNDANEIQIMRLADRAAVFRAAVHSPV